MLKLDLDRLAFEVCRLESHSQQCDVLASKLSASAIQSEARALQFGILEIKTLIESLYADSSVESAVSITKLIECYTALATSAKRRDGVALTIRSKAVDGSLKNTSHAMPPAGVAILHESMRGLVQDMIEFCTETTHERERRKKAETQVFFLELQPSLDSLRINLFVNGNGLQPPLTDELYRLFESVGAILSFQQKLSEQSMVQVVVPRCGGISRFYIGDILIVGQPITVALPAANVLSHDANQLVVGVGIRREKISVSGAYRVD
jgi:hypothetical protein